MEKITIFWFRRDLRLQDNAGLYRALKSNHSVLPLFIFDTNILDDLEDRQDPRVTFLHQTVTQLKNELEEQESSLIVEYGNPIEVWKSLLKQHNIAQVFTNHDFEPYAIQRDKEVAALLEQNDIEFLTYKDHVIFEKGEVVKDDGLPYTVFTPYSKKWKKKLATKKGLANGAKDAKGSYYFQSYPSHKYFQHFATSSPLKIPSLADMNFEPSALAFPGASVKQGLIRGYDKTRNFPAVDGTSKLGLHFRFGTISIREKARKALALNETFLNELIWRDFYSMILFHFPHVVSEPFREKYKFVTWRNNEAEFDKWCTGQTGYPIVDAGMRELNTTGHMHNRVRMITASFLTKHLLIDWRWGEAYFAKKLLDFDLASNNGGWQWAAGCGTDAAPYFRIFNPYSQQEKFDKEFVYIKKWVPEFGTSDYPQPIVDHKQARERCLAAYKAGLANAASVLNA